VAVAERHFSIDHPAAQGHFPGDPIIPGAVLLNETLQAITACLDAAPSSVHLRSAKFLRPTRPGDRVAIEFSRTAQGEVRFECTVDGKSVLTGQFRWNDMPAAG
jgi:3-hydroxyacyl-[acyl-carrier-protein] dehydratase